LPQFNKYRAPLMAGYTYHIYNRGNNRETLFRTYRNYVYFLRLYKKYLFPFCDTLAYCLLPNHFHFLVRFLEENFDPTKVSRAFAAFFGTYTKAINKAYTRTGKLFEGRYRRKLVLDKDYLLHLVKYIHLNPQSHGLIADFRKWQHSSFYELQLGNRTIVNRQHLMETFGGVDGFLKAHTIAVDEPLDDEMLFD